MDMTEMPPVDLDEEAEGKKPNRLFLGLILAMVALLVVGVVAVVLFRMRGAGDRRETAQATATPTTAAIAAQSLATIAPTATSTKRPTNTPVVLIRRTDTPAAAAGAAGGPTETPTIDIGGGAGGPTETPTIDIGGGAGGATPPSVIEGPTVIVIPVDTPTRVVPIGVTGTTPQTGFGLEALLGGAALGVILLIARRLRLTS